MNRDLGFRCPGCNRKLAPVGGVQVATQVVRRTCRGCRTCWQIVVVPTERNTPVGRIWIDAGTFTKLPNERINA